MWVNRGTMQEEAGSKSTKLGLVTQKGGHRRNASQQSTTCNDLSTIAELKNSEAER